jgi:hypothetical protein
VVEPVYVGGAKKRYNAPTGRHSRKQIRIIKYRRRKKAKTKSIRSPSVGDAGVSGPLADINCGFSI